MGNARTNEEFRRDAVAQITKLGYPVAEVAKELDKRNLGVAVLHVPAIKPLDVKTIRKEAQKSGRLVVVAENHTEIGGLGEAIARDFLLNGVAPKFRHIALPDEFLLAGALPTLHDRYGISTNAIVKRLRKWLK